MLSPEMRSRLFGVATLAIPVVLVKVAALSMGSTTSRAEAAPKPVAATAAASVGNTSSKPSAKQLAAADHVRWLIAQPYGEPPMLFERTATVDASPAASTDSTTPVTTSNEIPRFTLRAVMLSSNGHRALINGQPYREGQTVQGTSWSIAAINTTERSVKLQDAGSDRTVTITVEQP